jgi:hypothetical protein
VPVGGEKIFIARPKKKEERSKNLVEIVKERAQVTKEGGKKEKKNIFRTESPSTTTVNQTGPNVFHLYFVPMHTHIPSAFSFIIIIIFFLLLFGQ